MKIAPSASWTELDRRSVSPGPTGPPDLTACIKIKIYRPNSPTYVHLRSNCGKLDRLDPLDPLDRPPATPNLEGRYEIRQFS
jgi:hypothetical protein